LTIKSAQHTANSRQLSVFSCQPKALYSAFPVNCELKTALVSQIRLCFSLRIHSGRSEHW